MRLLSNRLAGSLFAFLSSFKCRDSSGQDTALRHGTRSKAMLGLAMQLPKTSCDVVAPSYDLSGIGSHPTSSQRSRHYRQYLCVCVSFGTMMPRLGFGPCRLAGKSCVSGRHWPAASTLHQGSNQRPVLTSCR